MKIVILAGGFGSRLAEETEVKPKPMVEVGGMPIIWHIMSIYAAAGFNEFVIALGYKGDVIKNFFLNYCHHHSDLTVRLKDGRAHVSRSHGEDWIVHLMDTGLETGTGGRLKRLLPILGGKTFCMTYGDGLADIDAAKLAKFHRRQKKLVTLTAVRPPARFGGLELSGDLVTHFNEKPQVGEGWINGGFCVMDKKALEYISDDTIMFERQPLEQLAKDRQLTAYRHEGFWQCMDTLRDVRLLNALWASGQAPWKIW